MFCSFFQVRQKKYESNKHKKIKRKIQKMFGDLKKDAFCSINYFQVLRKIDSNRQLYQALNSKNDITLSSSYVGC